MTGLVLHVYMKGLKSFSEMNLMPGLLQVSLCPGLTWGSESLLLLLHNHIGSLWVWSILKRGRVPVLRRDRRTPTCRAKATARPRDISHAGASWRVSEPGEAANSWCWACRSLEAKRRSVKGRKKHHSRMVWEREAPKFSCYTSACTFCMPRSIT